MSTLVENELHVAFVLFASLRDKGRLEEASVIAEQALEQASTSLGESHPATATALFNLATVYEGKGEFETALRLVTRAVASYESLGGASHPVLASPLNLLGMLHQQLGHYAVAEPLFLRSLAIKKQSLGDQHPDVAIGLDNLAMLYKQTGDFVTALPLSHKALAIARQSLGPDHPTVATILSNQGTLCSEIGDYRSAESLHRQALDIRRKELGEQHPLVGHSLDELGLLYQKSGDYEAAEPLHRQALAIARQGLGDRHPDVAVCLSNTAMLQRLTGRYQEAELLYLQALDIRRMAYGEEHPAVSGSLNNLALLYRATDNYRAADPLYQQALAIDRKVLGEEHPDVAIALDNLATLRSETGDYRTAELMYRQALAIRRKALGEAHPEVAESLNNLALLLQRAGDYSAVEPLYREALAIRRSTLGDEDPAVATILSNLALLYRVSGNYQAAEPLYQQALVIRRKAFGERHMDVADTLNNLAVLYQTTGQFAAARDLCGQALKIAREMLGEDHTAVATFLGNLATLHRSTGDYNYAQLLQGQALAIRRKALGEDHVDVALSMNELALLYQDEGDYEAAEPLHRQALSIRLSALGEEHPDVGVSLDNLASLCAATHRVDEAQTLMERSAGIADRRVWQIFAVSSERQRMAYLATLAGAMEAFVSLVVQYLAETPSALHSAFDLVLRRKSIGAEALAMQRDEVLGGHYASLKPTLQKLTALRRQIASKTLAGPGRDGIALHRRDLTVWNTERDRLEAELIRQIPEANLEQRLRTANRHLVANMLPEDSALVEFIRCEVRDFQALRARGQPIWQPAHYFAFVMHAGAAEGVRLVDLGDAMRIDGLIAAFRAWVAVLPERRAQPITEAGLDLRARLFDPLLPALGGCTQLFLALDGDLSRLPFDVLPTATGELLVDTYRIAYLSVGRDVIRFGAVASSQAEAPLVVACPDFDLVRKPEEPTTTESAIVGRASPARLSRALEYGSLHFDELEGTRLEGERVADLLGVVPWLYGEVLEGPLKACRSPRVMHLATHGFFLPDQIRVSKWNADEETSSGVQTSAAAAFGRLAVTENPLLRSGLALAGVNTWVRGGLLPPEAEDGLLTAEDVTGMDLLATELVVLSACDTGLGDVLRGEGVFGLRRAFLLAGAKTVVMSLWEVPDEETCILMEDFYRGLAEGAPTLNSPAKALRQAQRSLRENPATADPYYWGAFICEGYPGH